MIDTIIFDFDGTLVDSLPMWDNLVIDYLASLGIKATPTINIEMATMTISEAASYLSANYPLAPASQVETEIKRLLKDKYLHEVNLMPKVQPTLINLAKRYHLVVLSDSDSDIIREYLNKYELISYFDLIIGGNQTKQAKCNFQTFLQLDFNLSKAVLVDDSTAVLQAAHQAGLATIGYNNHNGDEIITSLDELERILK